MVKNRRQLTIDLIRELYKHAQRDDCYNCKQLLKAMGLDPQKSPDLTKPL